MDKERGRTRERELPPWTEFQGVVSFVILLILCLSFYVLGIFVGRASNSGSSTTSAHSVSLGASFLDVKNKETNPSKRLDPSLASETTDKAEKIFIEQKKDFLPDNSEKYYIQVASASSQEESDKIVGKLRKIKIDSVHVLAPQPNSVAQFYVVRVGPYDVDTARQVAEELQQEHSFKGIQVMPKPTEK